MAKSKKNKLHNSDTKTEFIITKVSTGEYVKSVNPLVLTTVDAEAEIWNSENDADDQATALSQSEGEEFKVGRPGDRHP